MTLQKKHLQVISEFLNELTTEDHLHEMIVLCYEAWNTQNRNAAEIARNTIAESIKKSKREAYTLYNKQRNISINQTYGDSRAPAEEFLNLSQWSEWS